MTAINVVPNPEGGWSVRRSGARRALKRFDTKEAAVSYAMKICEKTGEPLDIRKKEGGKIRYEYRRT